MQTFNDYVIKPKDDKLPDIRCPHDIKKQLLIEFSKTEFTSFAQFLMSKILNN